MHIHTLPFANRIGYHLEADNSTMSVSLNVEQDEMRSNSTYARTF